MERLMIIELHLKIDEIKSLLAAWEFSESLWVEKSISIKNFLDSVFESQKIPVIKTIWNNNYIYEINAKPFHFYDLQDSFSEYFKTLGAEVIVS